MAANWRLDELLDSADCLTVIKAIGMKTKKNGNSLFCECVSGTHKETRINHCQVFKHAIHCYSCGAHYTIYNMVKEYYKNVQGIELTHDEICEIIANTCGGPESFLEKPVNKKDRFPFKKEEIEALNLIDHPIRATAIVSVSSCKDEEHRLWLDDDMYGKEVDLPLVSLRTLFKEDKEAFWYLIKSKYNEALERCFDAVHEEKNSSNPNKEYLAELNEKYSLLMKLRTKIKKVA